jgi:hypothetical protein
MDKDVIVKHYKEYLEIELNTVKRIFNNPISMICDANEIYSQTIKRVVGVSTFVQDSGVDYFVIDFLYEKFKIKLSKLLDERKQI